MNDPEPVGTRTRSWRALLACLGLIVLLAVGVLNVWMRGASVAPPAGSAEADSSTAAVRDQPGPVEAGGAPQSATEDAPAVAGQTSADPQPADPPPASGTAPAAGLPATTPGPADEPSPPVSGTALAAGLPPATPGAVEPPPLPPGPWTAALSAEGQLPPFEQVCYDDFDPSRTLPLPQELESWFTRVAGEPLEIRSVRTRLGECGRFEGLMRLKMPLRAGAAVRLNLIDVDRLQIHLFAGREGTTLSYYQRDQSRWTAYRTTRRPGQPRPETFLAATTDDARTRRTKVREGAALALRCVDGQAILSHGNVVLLRAPLAALPEEVYFEGQGTFFGIAAIRSAAPPESPPADPATLVIDRPAELDWTEQLPEGASLERREDGAVELLASRTQQAGWVTAPLDLPVPSEVVLQLDEASAGTGVFLGAGDKRPTLALRFMTDKTSGHTCVLVRDFDAREVKFPSVQDAFVPLAPAALWVRLLFACGTLHCWTSADGVHWVAAEKYGSDVTEPATHLGLMHQGALSEGRIRLRSLQVRPLPQLQALAEPELVSQVKLPERLGTMPEWLTWTAEHCPPGVDPGAWRRASAIRTLGPGCGRILGTRLVELLLDDAASSLPADRQLALLAEAARLLTVRDDYVQRERLLERYHRLGLESFRRDGQRPYSLILEPLLSVPLAPHDELRVAREATIRTEIVQLSYEDRWQELFDFCRQLRFFRQEDVVPLLDWAVASALRYLPQGAGGPRLVGRKQDWSPLWIGELSRPSYNFLAELQAMLDSAAWQDAGRYIAGLDAHQLTGLATHVQDARRHLSMPTALRATLADWPQLQDVIREQYEDLAALRIRSAIERADAAALDMTAVQFAGTAAAGRAHQWLGDRALAGGWFTTALAEYRRGQASADPLLRRELLHRQRLAAAMQGQRLEGQAEEEVVLGQYRLSGQEFERLIEEMIGTHAPAAALRQDAPQMPPPSGYRVQRRGRLDGPIGRDPKEQATPHVVRFGADWVGRQLGTAATEDTLYVSNRFHLAAYDLGDGNRRWQWAPRDATPLRAQDWGLIAMRPLIAGQRIYARLLYEPAPRLVCLDRTDGQARWTTELAPNQAVVSDPLLVQGQLAAFTVQRQEQGSSQLRLSLFDADTGRLQVEHDLLRVNEVWWRRRCCEAIEVDDALVAVLAGVTFCCDLDGDLRWLREHTTLPPDEAPQWVLQAFQPPIRIGDRVIVAQPGVEAVECLDVSSGRAEWVRIFPGLRRLIGRSADRLIAEQDGWLLALDVATGQTVWRTPAASMLHAAACDDQRVLFAQSTPPQPKSKEEGCHLVWLDAATGQPQATTALAELSAEHLKLGPLIFRPDRIWGFSTAGKENASPEWIELLPQDSPDAWPRLAAGGELWPDELPAALLQMTRRRFPGWELISAGMDPQGPVQPERSGRKDVLLTQAKRGQPVVFVREVAVPARGQPRLRLAFGQSPEREWVLEVRFRGQELHRQEISGGGSPEPWSTAEIDLRPVAGQSGQLIIEAQLRAGRDKDIVQLYWSDIEIVF